MDIYLRYNQILKRTSINDFRRRLKLKAIEYKGGKCAECGYDKSHSALQFHHLDPAKKDFSISAVKSSSWENIKPELDKCILLCANCHLEEHEKQRLDKSSYEKNELLKLRQEIKIERVCSNCQKQFKVHETATSTMCTKCLNHFKGIKIGNGRRRDRPTPDALQELINTKSISDIAKQYGCGGTTIRRFCHELAITTPSKSVLAERMAIQKTKINWPSDESLSELVFKKPLSHLAKTFGVSDKSIKKHCERRNITSGILAEEYSRIA